MKSPTLLLACLFSVSIATPPLAHPDEVKNLPGLNFPINYRQYSGYLEATGGRHLHYWFVESQNNPATDPVVLWMNGGPGCSSLLGFLGELGPLHVNTDSKTLYNNPYSWNKLANVVFLEAPAGVGFSYSNDQNYTTNDDETAANNLAALHSFFKKFPQFVNNDFYVTGESYGGIYVPTLSLNIVNDPNKSIKFKGFAIGNAYLDVDKLGEKSLVFLAYYHGFFGKSTYNRLAKSCCRNNVFSHETCDFDKESDACQSAVADALTGFGEVDPYDIYDDCNGSPLLRGDPRGDFKNSRQFADRQLLSKTLNNVRNDSRIKRHLNGPTYYCPLDHITDYLNRADVREALHIPSQVQEWQQCGGVDYTRQYDTMRPQMLKLTNSSLGLKIMIYNGDVDTVCNFLGDEWFIDDLNLKLVSDFKPWRFTDGSEPDENGGFIKSFKGLDFVTVRGSGHMVPEDKPAASLAMFKHFLGVERLRVE